MIKVALLLCSDAVCTAEHRKNSKPELQNQFLFCNKFLLFVRYLHGGRHPPSELGILNFELEEELQFIGEFINEQTVQT